MSEPTAPEAAGRSAGALLRAARERQGLHIAALAATIKIPQRKLEALEADRYDELPDATFARALAMTVCRALKVDAAPVLALLPPIGGRAPDVAGGLNAPYRERSGRGEPAHLGLMRHPLSWAALLMLVAAALVFLLPSGWWRDLLPGTAVAPAAGAEPAEGPAVSEAASGVAGMVTEFVAAASAAASVAAVEVVQAVSAEPDAGASAAADASGSVAVLRANASSWVEVIDAGGQVLVQRVLQPGERLGLDGRLPLRLKIGNAAATQLQFRGQDVDLAAVTRDNVARLELK